MLEYSTAEELRIIAKDAHLPLVDRDVLARAADELDLAYRQLISDNIALVALHNQQMALQERIRELSPKSAWAMAAGVQARLG